jgi:hypothetical protein
MEATDQPDEPDEWTTQDEEERTRREREPQRPVVEVDSFDPETLPADDLAALQAATAEWIADRTAPSRPLLAVRLGPSQDWGDVADALMHKPFRTLLTPATCYMKFCVTSGPQRRPNEYPGMLDEGPRRAVLWVTSGG